MTTLLAAAVGALLATALLGDAFGRRSTAVVVLAAVVPSADAVASLAVHGATGALFHTLVIPATAGLLVYWDTRLREGSWLRGQYGWHGIRVAWVALASYVVAGIGTALFSPDGAAILYPLSDRFFAVAGHAYVSTHDGFVQTYVEFGGTVLSSPGTVETHHVASWINPTPGTGVEFDADRRLTVVESGWQAVVVVTAAALLSVQLRGER